MMKKIFSILAILAILALFAACNNPFVMDLLPDRNGDETDFIVTFDKNHSDTSGWTEADPRTITVAPPEVYVGELPGQPTRAEHEFNGWNTESDGSGTAFWGSTKVTADITVYAQWLFVPPDSFVVTFDKNGGDTDADPRVKIVEPPAATIDALPQAPTWTGFTFNGWNTERNGTGSEFTESATVTKSITVYAQWTPVPPGSFIVTFNRNGGDTDADPPFTVVTPPETTVGTLPAPPTRNGYTFTGWNTEPDGSGTNFIASTTVTIDIIVYAQWLLVPPGSFIVTFNRNGGDTDAVPASTVITPPATTIDQLPTPPTRANYDFTGWNTEPDGSGTSFIASTTVTASFIVYAQWTPQGTPPASAIVDFENYTLGPHSGVVKGYNTNGDVLTPTVNIVNDPVNAGQKSMSISSTDYGQAAIVPITLSAALNTAESFTFKFLLPSGTISYKKVLVYIASSADTFVTGGFGNPIDSQYAQFAANKLGETAEEINNSDENVNITFNEWKTYTISIDGASLNAAIRDLTGNVYLAIGIHHSNTEAITYLLDDFAFTFGNPPPPPPAFPTLVDFETDTIGATYGFTRGDNSPTVTVAANPTAASQKSLRVVTSSSSAWNQAAIIPINIPDALNTYRSFTFRFYYQSGGTLLDNGQPRKINVYVADNTDAFKQYAFGNPSGNANQFANLLLGEIEPDYNKTGQWVDYAINFTSPGAQISGLTGNVYVAIGINHNTSVTYYLDDLTFSKTEVVKEPGVALDGTLAVNATTQNSVEITAGSVTVPSGSTQTIEYSVSLTSAGAPGVWQTGRTFTGLTANTAYTAYARAAANAHYNAGPEKTAAFTTLEKLPGETVAAPTLLSKTHSRITVNAVTPPVNGQTVEYAISKGTTAPESGWQAETTFRGLDSSASYYVFARAAENGNNFAGAASSYLSETTDSYTPPPVPPSVVNFEDKNINDTYNRVSGQGSTVSTATVVIDPASTAEKSLRITSSGWNNGAIIPINLPFALKNYESFTFRYRLATTMGESNRGNGIWVYVTSSTSGLTGNQLGNDHASYNPILLKNIVPNYTVTNQWVDAEISLMDNSGNSTAPSGIQNLQGDVFLVIGMNSGITIEYYLDDLTFDIYEEFEPTPSISPTTATFDKNTSNIAEYKDITVNMNLYGSSFTSISGGSPTIGTNNYTVSGNEVTLKKEYLETLGTGPTTLTFTFSGGTSTIVITIRDSTGTKLKHTFTYGTDPGVILSNSANFSATVTAENVLQVSFTTSYSNRTFALPFNVGTTKTLADYWGIKMVVRRVSGDVNNSKTMYAEAVARTNPTTTLAASGSNLAFGSRTLNPLITGTGGVNDWQELTIPRTSNAAANSLSGEVYIGLYIGNTTQFVYEIQSIELLETAP